MKLTGTAVSRLDLQQRIGMLLFASGWLALMSQMSEWLADTV